MTPVVTTSAASVCSQGISGNLGVKIMSSYLLHDGDGISRKRRWILHIIIDDAVKHLLFILTGKRRLAGEQRDAESAFKL